ncbi:transglutaminase-like cysteine peptidase [Hoeflea sp. BAL378]|uniref:transglutaminase-like cysteine peptidase n=1 Tax=Hoeflea sp. BAL378 TaxID=1547437 RepID=UPI00137827F8|nr:transglutaminase-like cysteine peptidase [Hoeflea sp. BAL378]
MTGTPVAPAPAPVELALRQVSAALPTTGPGPGARNVGFGAILGYPGRTAPAELGAHGDQALTTASIAPAAYALRQDQPLFGAHRIRFGKIKSGGRIATLIRGAAASEPGTLCVGRCASLAARLTLHGASARRQFEHVSMSVNRAVRYDTDARIHGRLDYWSTPDETLARGAGDCEDYAILKMALLARLGVPLSSMEIVVVKDTGRRLFHAVLSVSLNGEHLILDNMTNAVEADLAKRDYAPLFSIAGAANYVFGYKADQPKLVASIGEAISVAPGAGF